jgi:K+-transporting ATPase ATPase C chain
MKRNLLTAILMTITTTILFGVVYPLLVTGISQILFPKQANGELITRDGVIVGSRLIGQGFSSSRYFWSRPSSAGNGYDAGNSGGSNLGPTNQKLIDRVKTDATTLEQENPKTPIPVDLVTSSGSGLDPDISPAGAAFQIPRVAKARGLSDEEVRQLVAKYTEGRQLGFLGEPRVNVVELNLALDALRRPSVAAAANNHTSQK